MRVLWKILGVGHDPAVTYVRDGADWPPLLRMPLVGELVRVEHVITSDERPYRRDASETFRVIGERFVVDLRESQDTFWEITLEKHDAQA